MRKTVRLLTSTALGAVLLLSLGVGATLANPAGEPAADKPTVQVIDLGDDWCFDDSVDLYCNVQSGKLTIKEWADGTSDSRVHMVTKTVITHDGAFVATTTLTKDSHSRYGADGSSFTDEREHSVWTDGVQTCVSDSHFKRIDFDVKIDTLKWHCD